MTTLKIQGSDKKIKQLARELKVRASRTGLEMSLTKAKMAELSDDVKPEVKKAVKAVKAKKAKSSKK